MHCRRRLCAGAGPEETLALVSLRLWSSKRPGFHHNPRVVWRCSSIYSGAICDISRRRSSTMTVGGERDSFFDVHQQGRIEAPERLIAELLLKNEKLRMAAISTAHEEDPNNNSGVTLTNAPTASRLCNQAGDEQCRIDQETS